jgi:hypothetical protein
VSFESGLEPADGRHLSARGAGVHRGRRQTRVPALARRSTGLAPPRAPPDERGLRRGARGSRGPGAGGGGDPPRGLRPRRQRARAPLSPGVPHGRVGRSSHLGTGRSAPPRRGPACSRSPAPSLIEAFDTP